MNRSEYEQALPFQLRILAIQEQHFPDSHMDIIKSLMNIGDLQSVLHDQEEEEAVNSYSKTT